MSKKRLSKHLQTLGQMAVPKRFRYDHSGPLLDFAETPIKPLLSKNHMDHRLSL